MGMKSTISLINKYSKTARDVENSAIKMSKAVGRVAGEAKKSTSALNLLTKRRHDIRIKDVGSKEAQRNIKAIQKAYQDATGKRYKISVQTDMSRLQQLKSTLKNIRDFGKKFVVETGSFAKAWNDTRRLNSEMRKLTGKRHKLRVEIPDTWKSGLGAIKTAISGLGSAALAVGGFLAKGLMAAGGAIGGLGVAAGGFALKKGYDRLTGIETSKARLGALGHDKASIDGIMDNALASVKGTPFGLGEAAGVAGMSVASGVNPGAELESHLKTVANAAAFAGTDLNEMGSIFNRVKTTGYAYNDTLQMMADRQIPVYQKIAEKLGITMEDVRKMAADGGVTFEMFSQVMQETVGNAAEAIGQTLPGQIANLGAALSRVGAGFLGAVFPFLKDGAEGLTKWADSMTEKATQFGERFAHIIPLVRDKAVEIFGGIKEFFAGFGPEIQAVKEQYPILMGYLKEFGTTILPPLIEVVKEVATALIEMLPGAIELGQTVFKELLIPAGEILASIITDVVIPVFKIISDVINDVAIPAMEIIAKTISSLTEPAMKALQEVIDKWVKPALDKLSTATDKITGVFKDAAGAVSDFIDKIKGVVSGIWSRLQGESGDSGNATGTTHWRGGWTKINERGAEMMRLPRGTTIYPSGKTDKLMKRNFRHTPGATGEKNVEINIHVQGGESNEETAKIVKREIRKLIPNM